MAKASLGLTRGSAAGGSSLTQTGSSGGLWGVDRKLRGSAQPWTSPSRSQGQGGQGNSGRPPVGLPVKTTGQCLGCPGTHRAATSCFIGRTDTQGLAPPLPGQRCPLGGHLQAAHLCQGFLASPQPCRAQSTLLPRTRRCPGTTGPTEQRQAWCKNLGCFPRRAQGPVASALGQAGVPPCVQCLDSRMRPHAGLSQALSGPDLSWVQAALTGWPMKLDTELSHGHQCAVPKGGMQGTVCRTQGAGARGAGENRHGPLGRADTDELVRLASVPRPAFASDIRVTAASLN